MKPFVAALAVLSIAFSAVASGASGVLLTNGDVEISDVGSVFAAKRAYLDLNEDVTSRVVCQVFYRDDEEDAEPLDESDVDLLDEWVNTALEMYLHSKCGNMSLEELVAGCRSGSVYERLNTFPEWVSKVIEMINEDEVSHRRQITVTAVVIKPVGEFCRLVSE